MSDQQPGHLPEDPTIVPAAQQPPSSQQDPQQSPLPEALTPSAYSSYPPLFESSQYAAPFTTYQPITRTPNFADLLIFSLMLLVGFLVMMGSVGAAVHYHWFGIRNAAQMQSNTRIALGSEGILYAVALACSIPIFRIAWNKPFLAGLHWHGKTASRLYLRLAGIAVLCNIIAMLGNAVLPFPEHAPIDKMFSTTTDAYLLMAFGVTVAPFFEELIFRGFLLPAIATAWDWGGEKITHRLPHPLDAEDNPVWTPGAQIFSALIVSAPFALMHAEQVGNSWGPVLLLYCVSLILSAVRLRTRSLASSTLVHATYNFILFAEMFFSTDAFRHLDKA